MKNENCKNLIDTFSLCLVLLVVLMATGCATDPAVMQMAIDAQRDTKPTLKVTCPTGGCAIEYVDPRDRQAVKLPTNGWDFANNVVNTTGQIVAGAVVPAAFAITATKGFDALKGSGAVQTTTTTTTNNTTSSVATSNTTSTALSGSGVIGNGTHTAPTTTTTTTTTDNHSQTATPTVVTQPPPVIVTP